MAIFDTLFDRLMKHEGGYVNNPNDPGGETMWGVTKSVARQYGYTGAMRQLPKATAQQIADKLYWQAIQGDKLDRAIAWQLVDAAYNHGNRNAVKMLQRAVGVTDDGIIGNQTLAAVAIIEQLNIAQPFYICITGYLIFYPGYLSLTKSNL